MEWSDNFSYEYYNKLLDTLKTKYTLTKMSDALKLDNNKLPVAFLRHDIDVSSKHAVQIAKLESEKCIATTFYVRSNARFYSLSNPYVINDILQIEALGHEIGLHYDQNTDHDDIDVEIESLEFILDHDIRSVSFHRPEPKYMELGLVYHGKINVYSPQLRIRYITDSAGRWREGEPLIELEDNRLPIQIVTHPIWWGQKTIPELMKVEILSKMKQGW